MKIIFLDIDGVLNSEIFAIKRKGHDIEQFCPTTVVNLNSITNKTDAVIVISSTWRKGKSLKRLAALLKKNHVTGKVISSTPILHFEKYNNSPPRGCEIAKWLKDNNEEDCRYVILDDDTDMLLSQQASFFHCDPYCGLSNDVAWKVTNYLNNWTR